MFKLMGKKKFTILRLIFLSKPMEGERGSEGEREERVGEKERERGRKEREETSSYTTLFIWKYDTFVTHSWGSLKYDYGLI